MTRKVQRTTVLIAILVAFIAGLGIARLKIYVPLSIPLFTTLMGVGLFRFLRPIAISIFIITSFLLGLSRGNIYMTYLADYQELYKQPVTLLATSTQDATYSERKQLAFTARNLQVIEPNKRNLVGEVTIEGFGAPMVFKGDRVKVSGKIYKTLGGKQGSVRYAQIEVIGRQQTFIDHIRHRFAASIYTALPEPLASFALGLLIGQRSTLPKEVADNLTAVGLTHIVAVSGYNLTILVRAVQRLLGKHSRYQTAMWSLALVIVFVLLVGNSPSILRAAIVSFISIVAWYYGRAVRPVLLLMLVAAMTAGFNPVYLWSDIGWYLSFLAFFGVLVLAPLIVKRLSKYKEPKLITLVLIETIAAQIMTIPIIIYIFGRTSLISIPANLLVVPFVPLAMLLSVVAGISGLLLAAISSFIALPAQLVLTYMLDVAELFNQIPNVVMHRTITLTQMVYMYILLCFLTIVFWRKDRGHYDTITDKKVSL